MLFNSFQFLLFFPVVVILYFSIPHRYRWILLLAASYYFYMCWKAEYLLLIIISTAIDYFAGLRMEQAENKRIRKLFLLLSLCSNLGILFAFKYFNFFSASLTTVFSELNLFYHLPTLKILLPVGISFYTFQTLSYTIDVYRGQRRAEKHLGIFAVYVAFFPQLVAGPIERSTRLIPQFYREVSFDYDRITDGLKLMAWGFFKKVVIADRLAVLVNQVYNNPSDFSGLPLWIASYFFAFQIYCDFSGYSDIAIGSAQVLGIRLMDNFKRPYFSTSVSEFWKRWHISLSSWFRDYLYISLGGNRVVKWRWIYNLFVVFLLSGLWHGANWTFVIWGGLHGFYLVFSIFTKNIRYKITHILRLERFPLVFKFIKTGITFHLVLFAWIFFRANHLNDALYIIHNLFADFSLRLPVFELSKPELILSVFAIFLLLSLDGLKQKYELRNLIRGFHPSLRWAIYLSALLLITIFGFYSANLEFIYFQF